MRSSRIAAVLTVAVAAVTASAALAAPWRVIGQGSASGSYAIALAAASTHEPTAFAVRIRAVPSQRVHGNWTILCSKDGRAASRSGRFAGTTPVLRVMRLPIARAAACVATGGGALTAKGTVRVEILKR